MEDKCLRWPKNGFGDSLDRTVGNIFGSFPGQIFTYTEMVSWILNYFFQLRDFQSSSKVN